MKKMDKNIRLSLMYFLFSIMLLIRFLSGNIEGWRSYFIPVALIICIIGTIYNLIKISK